MKIFEKIKKDHKKDEVVTAEKVKKAMGDFDRAFDALDNLTKKYMEMNKEMMKIYSEKVR